MKSLFMLLLCFCIALPGCRSEKYEFQEMPIGIDAATQLISQEGKTEPLLTEPRPVTLLFFGFTRCPDFCPLTLHRIDGIVKGNAKLAEKTRLLFISVDTAREKPNDLKTFLKPFPYARGFSGTKNEIADLEKKLGAYSKEEAGKLSHSLYIYVLNKQGKVIFLLRHDDPIEKIRGVLEQAAG
jgi:protein SCO1/2